MTNREFYNSILASSVSAELKAFASAEVAKLDKANAKRRSTPSKAQVANEAVKSAILIALRNDDMVASEVAAKVGISTQKASALCRTLVTEGHLTVADRKVKGKGTVKCYSLVADEDGDDTDGEPQALPHELAD